MYKYDRILRIFYLFVAKKTSKTDILHGAAKTGVWGKDPKKHLWTQLSNKILVQGQHAHFIEQDDP